MKRLHSFKLVALLSVVAGSLAIHAGECDGPLESGSWYVLPKIGVAPGIFANRGYEKCISPLGSNDADQKAVVCSQFDTPVGCQPVVVAANQNNILQQDACKIPKFGDIFSNGVLHVGFELGRNVCDNSAVYLEFVYNRASGSCVNSTSRKFAAPDGCLGNDCCTTTGSELSSSSRTTKFDDYSAYGAYIGSRHYWDCSFFCDRAYFWGGFKFGILHRKQVCACITTPDSTQTVEFGEYAFAGRTVNETVFCKSNAVSGGLSLGLDYCINDCWTVLVGFEVVASCPFKSNMNVRVPLADNPTSTSVDLPSGFFAQPTNIIWGNTGTFVQFPVWVGLKWEFDWCNDICNPCA